MHSHSYFINHICVIFIFYFITLLLHFYFEEASTKRAVLSQGFVDHSDGGGPTFVNHQFHNHYVMTALYTIILACDIDVNLAYLVPSL